MRLGAVPELKPALKTDNDDTAAQERHIHQLYEKIPRLEVIAAQTQSLELTHYSGRPLQNFLTRNNLY
jgi:hypothetical protein